jgi:hypothetical protein
MLRVKGIFIIVLDTVGIDTLEKVKGGDWEARNWTHLSRTIAEANTRRKYFDFFIDVW